MPGPISPAYDFSAYQTLDNGALTRRIEQVRRDLGPRLLILGHHYQQDDIIALSDLRGDSYQLASLAASHDECRAIAFCGVHFMAETADILANRPEKLARRAGGRVNVILPDLEAGCSLADMANIRQVEDCWRQLSHLIDVADLMPITYVNSAADLKAFCGRHGGIVCTSANARAALDWAFARRGRVLFFPDQHLGRNTAKAMGIPLDQMPLWNPLDDELGGNTPETIRQSRVLLWQGDCSIHQRFLPQHVEYFRKKYPGVKILVHPECSMEVVDMADVVGSTGKIIQAVQQAPPSTIWAIGTELHLVARLKKEHPVYAGPWKISPPARP
jgi:quinolinate synthase